MSLCYRRDGRKTTVRVKDPQLSVAADGTKIPNFQSLSSKRKPHSISSTTSHSSLRSWESEKENEKKQRHETKLLSSKPRSPSTQPSSHPPCRSGNKPTPSQKQDKQNVQNNVKAEQVSSIDHKRRELLDFLKKLILAQNTFIDMFAQLRELENRSGVPPVSAGDVRLLTVTEWPVHDLLLLAQNTPTQQHAEINGVLGPKVLQQLNCKLAGIPDEVMNLATELMQRRLELLEYVRCTLHSDKVTYEGKKLEWRVKNAKLDEESDKLRKLVIMTVKSCESKIIYSLNVAKIPWIDRDNLIKKIESLQKELSIHKTNKSDASVKSTTVAIETEGPVKNTTPTNTLAESETTPIANEHKATQKDLEAMKEAVVAAEAKLAAAEAKLAAVEPKLATARARCFELEQQLKDTTVELVSAQCRLDNIKQLQHYRAASLESRSKKLEKISKDGEVTVIEVLSRQRDTLELRIRELQEQATVKSRDAETRENQLTSRIESLKSKLEEQETRRESLEVQVEESQKCYKDLQEQFNTIKERSRELIKLQQQKCIEYLPRKVQCSGKELEIWNDLQATKDVLARVKEELELTRADKDGLLSSLAKMAQEGAENKMAEELLSRERQITKMRNNIEELTENKRMMEERITCYENQLGVLQAEVNVLRNLKSYESYIQEIPHEELEREAFNLRLQVESLTRERAALTTELATRALLLDRHERCAELFAHVTRVRRDLSAKLEGNNAQAVFEGVPIHEVRDTLSKAYINSAVTWSALRRERMRVIRLENTILAQNDALERDGAARLKQERKRTQLERELMRVWAGNDNRRTQEHEGTDAGEVTVRQ